MIEITNEKTCTGCGACAAACPQGAIQLVEDRKGFRKPVINQDSCIDCTLCQKTCAEKIEFRKPKRTYIAKHCDIEVYNNSQSGGAFTAISDYILSIGGVIYGASYNCDFEVEHIRATTKEMRDKMRGSKYVQSQIDSVYHEIEKDLQNDISVLFVGTGCQVAGILKVFQKNRIDISKLYTVDILCHGVPSVLLWRDMLKYLENKYSQNINSVELKEIEENTRPIMNIKVGKHEIDDYLYRKLYYSNLALRESCYSCQYNRVERVGDITIGDAWGVEKINPSFHSKRGVSLILINSSKGLEMENSILKDMETEEVNINDYLQECMISSAKPKRKPDLFWQDYQRRKFSYVVEKYAKHNPFLNIPYILERIGEKIRGERI